MDERVIREASHPDPEPTGHPLALARSIGCGVAVVRDGRVSWANDACAELLAVRDPRDLSGASLDSLIDGALPPPGSREAAVFSLRTASGPRDVEILRLGELSLPAERDGDEAEEELLLIRDARATGDFGEELSGASRALYAANRELAQLRDQLAAEMLEREQLLSVVSHELRTPITVISGYNNLLLSDEVGALNEQQRSFLRESNKSCARLNRFVGDLLAACGETGSPLAIERKGASLEPLVDGLVSFFRPLLDERALELDIDLAPDALLAEFDGVRVEQVVTNLLSNAIRYSKPASAIRVRSHLVVEDGERVIELSVSDTGPGVADENRERIFEPYVRADDARDDGGLGLGLAICKRIVDAHGGRIWVEDDPGGGSRFAFTLPLTNSEVCAEWQR